MIPGKIPNTVVQKNFVNKLADLLLGCINNKKHKLFFFDPVHQTHNNENDRGWMEKGAEGTKNVLSNTGRRRVNIIGGLNAHSRQFKKKAGLKTCFYRYKDKIHFDNFRTIVM